MVAAVNFAREHELLVSVRGGGHNVACTATNREPVRFDVTGGTGAYAGARGGGSYDLAFTLPTCPGPQAPVHVWFRGHLETATP